LSLINTSFALSHATYTTIVLCAVLGFLKARLMSVPDVISFARACLKVAVAALAGEGIRVKLRSPIVAAAKTATPRRDLGRRI
jgi:hypothetical protein